VPGFVESMYLLIPSATSFNLLINCAAVAAVTADISKICDEAKIYAMWGRGGI